MNSQTVGLRVAGTIFGLVFLVHLVRLVAQFEILIAGWRVPLWPNVIGLLAAGSLSLWMWKLSFPAAK